MCDEPHVECSTLLESVGGAANVAHVSRCMVRLRLVLRGRDAVELARVASIPGVISVIESNGELHVVPASGLEELLQEVRALVDASSHRAG